MSHAVSYTHLLCLESERGKFKGVGHGDDFIADGRLKQRNLREAFAQTGFKTRDAVDETLDFYAGDDRFNSRMPAPKIGAAQGSDA